MRTRIKWVARALVGLALMTAAPVSTFAEALRSPCAERHHSCEAPAITSCCCLLSSGGSIPATTNGNQDSVAAPAAVDPLPGTTAIAVIRVPSQSWFRASARSAGPPLPLHLLNVSILR
jgi:hypothetical protein